MVESNSNITSDFNMLTLVVANRNFLCVIQQDVGRLKCGIRKQSSRNKICFTLGRFVFELGHSTEFAKTDRALHDPTKLRVLGNMRLHKNRCNIWVKTHRKEHRRKFHGVLAKYPWCIGHGERMEVNDAVKDIILVLSSYPVT